MPLADDIRATGRRALAALDAAHDYFGFSLQAWEAINSMADAGEPLRFQNPATGTTLDETTLTGWAARHVSPNLGRNALQQFVSVLEDFLFGLMRLWLAAHPRSLSRKQLLLSAVLDAPDKPAIVLAVVDRELNEVKYERLAEWFAYLEKLAKLGCPTADEIALLAEIKATRDVLVHNQGVANEAYVQKAGALARAVDGEILDAEPPYVEAAYPFLRRLVAELAEAASSKA